MINNICRQMPLWAGQSRFHFATGASFLKMVESFFDRAAVHTGIRTDRLNFYKKAENVVKTNIPLIRGTPAPTQTTAPSKPSLPTAASTRPTNSPPRAELATLKTSTSRR
jgi:hypothetical protein